GTGTGGTKPTACPSIEPAAGTSCTVEDHACSFANCRAPDYQSAHQLTCIDGAWTLTAESACDSGLCPTTLAPNLACDAAATPGPCPVVDACGVARTLYCVSDHWQSANEGTDDLAPAPPADGSANGDTGGALSSTSGAGGPPACPAVKPEVGASCCPPDYPAYCSYAEEDATSAGGASFLIGPGAGGA